ncbi:hypothetical protein K504DRAFT_460477 [Pleomassaria siparia CBS 279.74]|uniref:rRNA-processing protein n=1 Tax=Pleomassaria siparia CBS 279.74 TaxID=1314801 RepID=A0A6G1JYH4_9PLEO|nr:hypothetical protein K504DRAFT_460477 [Pleomassaria siparia CBS 279.74]
MSADTKTASAPGAVPLAAGMRVNGKQWHQTKTAFRPRSNQTSFEKRTEERKALAAVKAKEKEMKDEKEAARQERVEKIRTKRAAKEERVRYQAMEEKMHKKRVERVKRREKRNKMLKS